MTTVNAVVDDDAVGRVLAESAVQLPTRSSPLPRASAVIRTVWATPGRAAMTTACGFCFVVAVAAAATPASVTVTAAGLKERARCGLDVYVFGHPDHAVASACRTAEVSRMVVFLPAALVVVAGLVAAAALALRPRRATAGGAPAGRSPAGRWAALLEGLPAPAFSLPLGILAVVAGASALRPADVHLIARGQLITARCGIDTYVAGYPDRSVERACRHAYTGHAAMLIGAALVAGLVTALVLRRLPAVFPGWTRARLLAAGAAVALAVIAVIALFPTQVVVREAGSPVTARCGLDTYLAGYPDHAVESACRNHYSRHALVGVAAAADAVACALAARALRRRPPPALPVAAEASA